MEHKFSSSKLFAREIHTADYLYLDLWKEGTTSLLHAPREVNKTVKALEIAADIASDKRQVLFINAEGHLDNSYPQLAETDNLYIFTPEFESIDDKRDYADLVFEGIEQAVRTSDVRTFVIDSLTRIAALSFGRNASPAYIMKRIVALQVKCKLSILVVANDTTKRTMASLLAFADSEITMQDPEKDDCPNTRAQSDRSEPVAQSFSPAPTLTRQQRRALEREAAKRPAVPQFIW